MSGLHHHEGKLIPPTPPSTGDFIVVTLPRWQGSAAFVHVISSMFWITAATLSLMEASSLRYMLEKMYYGITCCPKRVIKSRRKMGGACSAYGSGERRIQVFWWGNLRERDNSGDPGIDGRIIL